MPINRHQQEFALFAEIGTLWKLPIPTMLEMYIIKKKNEDNFYKFQYENAQFKISLKEDTKLM
jgi:hypothetical protein